MKKQIGISLAILTSIAIAALAFYEYGAKEENLPPAPTETASSENKEEKEEFLRLTPDQISKADIQVQKAAGGMLQLFLTLPGKIVVNPERYAHVVTKSAGIVREAHKNMGDNVLAGERLAIIDSKEMAEAKSAYLTAKRQCALTKALFFGEKSLKNKGIGAKQEYLQAEANANEAVVACELAKQKLQALGVNQQELEQLSTHSITDLLTYEINAPFAGTVIKRHLTPGEVVDESQQAYIIADLTTVWLELGIYPKDLSLVRESQHVEVSNDCGDKALGTILRLSPVIDTDTARGRAIAVIDNEKGCWRPGGYVTSRVIIGKVNAEVLVPQEAVIRIDNQDYIFVAHPTGFEKRSVSKGRSDGQNLEIVTGLKPGEEYVAKNAIVLKFELTKGEPD